MRGATRTPRAAPLRRPDGPPGAICVRCDVPLDARPFDESGFAPAPSEGDWVVLARFTLPPEYCGLLEHFTQYTDAHAASPLQLGTPRHQWVLRVNGRPLDPYVNLRRIVNPWGGFALPLRIRLDDTATVELVVRGVAPSPETPDDPVAGERSAAMAAAPAFVGGRIVGRYWYDATYGAEGRT